jgi:glycosyltransferase involved in cell wall biosynthesis
MRQPAPMDLTIDAAERDDARGESCAAAEFMPGARSIAILLCTYNGARFLPQQLASFEAQDLTNWRLYVSDDGSTDGTQALLEDFRNKHGAEKVQLREGPRRGFVANFLSLICAPSVDGAFYALSDQDDVWHPNKLARAQAFLAVGPADVPALYGSRARLIGEDGAEIGLSPLFHTPLTFRHALVQNFAMGHTMMFNRAAQRVLARIGADVKPAVHDWWIYLAITALGGTVLYDPEPTVDYRIHGRNLIGTNPDRLRRAKMLLQRFKGWNDANVAALARIEGAMPEENRKVFELFRNSRKLSLVPRVYGLLRAGVHRETVRGNLELALAALIGQI